MLKCRDMTAMASDYLDHNLTLGQRVRIWLHLLICVHCRRFVRQLRMVVALLRQRQSRHTQPSEAFLRQCEERISEHLEH